MRRPVIAAASLGAALLLPSWNAGHAAQAASPGYRVIADQTFHATALGPNHDTACNVAYDLYVPAPLPAPGTAPAILTTNGFGGSKADQADVGGYFASRGYTVLSYSGLGFGGSGCNIELDDPDWDGRAASQLIDFLGGKPDGSTSIAGLAGGDIVKMDGPDDPRVGMIGGSYGGGIQFSTASVSPKLDTIIPEITWNDLAYSLTPNNVDPDFIFRDNPPGVPKFQWTSLFFAEGVATPAQHTSTTPMPPSTCPGFDPRVCPANISSAATSYPTQSTLDLLRHASMVSFGSKVRIPTMLLQGQADTLFNISDAVANMRQLQRNGAPVKLVLQDWGHSDGTVAKNELDFTNMSNPGYEGRLIQHWFDHYLKGLNVDTGPAVEYLQDWVYARTQDAATAYATAPAWPVGTTQQLALSGSGDLVSAGSAITAASVQVVNPGGGAQLSYSETSALQSSQPFAGIAPTDQAPGFAAWSTAPLTDDVISVGIPTVTLNLSSLVPAGIDPLSAPAVFVKLYDVAPDGSVDLPHRVVSPARLLDLSKPVTLTLPGVVHRYAKGHRIELVVASTDLAYLPSRVSNVYTVSTSPSAPSMLSLPVVRAAAVQSPVTESLPSGATAPSTGAVPGLANTARAGAPAAAMSTTALALLLGVVLVARRRRRLTG